VGAPPTLDLFVASEFATSTKLNELWTALGFLLGSGSNPKPYFIGMKTGTQQTLTTGTWTAITQDSEGVDTVNGHSTVTNTSRYTPTISGWFRTLTVVSYSANATGVRGARTMRNGAGVDTCPYDMRANSGAGDISTPRATGEIFCNGTTDYLEPYGYQASGGNLATSYTSNFVGCLFVAQWVNA
jgi:hypothetical protein